MVSYQISTAVKKKFLMVDEWVVQEKYLDSHLHLGLLEREIKTSDLCVLDTSGHLLSGNGAVKSVTVDLRIEQNETV